MGEDCWRTLSWFFAAPMFAIMVAVIDAISDALVFALMFAFANGRIDSCSTDFRVRIMNNKVTKSTPTQSARLNHDSITRLKQVIYLAINDTVRDKSTDEVKQMTSILTESWVGPSLASFMLRAKETKLPVSYRRQPFELFDYDLLRNYHQQLEISQTAKEQQLLQLNLALIQEQMQRDKVRAAEKMLLQSVVPETKRMEAEVVRLKEKRGGNREGGDKLTTLRGKRGEVDAGYLDDDIRRIAASIENKVQGNERLANLTESLRARKG